MRIAPKNLSTARARVTEAAEDLYASIGTFLYADADSAKKHWSAADAGEIEREAFQLVIACQNLRAFQMNMEDQNHGT